MSRRAETDIVEELLDAADAAGTMDREKLAVLLRRAALDIDALRDMLSIRQQVLEDAETSTRAA